MKQLQGHVDVMEMVNKKNSEKNTHSMEGKTIQIDRTVPFPAAGRISENKEWGGDLNKIDNGWWVWWLGISIMSHKLVIPFPDLLFSAASFPCMVMVMALRWCSY